MVSYGIPNVHAAQRHPDGAKYGAVIERFIISVPRFPVETCSFPRARQHVVIVRYPRKEYGVFGRRRMLAKQ